MNADGGWRPLPGTLPQLVVRRARLAEILSLELGEIQSVRQRTASPGLEPMALFGIHEPNGYALAAIKSPWVFKTISINSGMVYAPRPAARELLAPPLLQS